ncbi:MAG: Ig-like domain-containing protein [Myxococcota bacterium]
MTAFQFLSSTAPTVLVQEPAPLATSVPRGTPVTIIFTEPMDPSSLDDSTIEITNGGARLTGPVIASGQAALFQPAMDLEGDSNYVVTLTTAIRSAQGVPLAAPISWTFTTETGSDLTGPTVISTDPMDGATGIAANSEITVTFNEAIDSSTVDATSFVVEAPGGAPVAGSRAVQGSTILFSPLTAYADGTLHTVRVSPAVTDLAGNGLFGEESFTFTVAPFIPDTTAPTVIQTNPADGDPGALRSVTIQATFDEPMDITTFNTTTVLLNDDTASTAISGTVLASSAQSVRFVPDTVLAEGNDYTVSLTAGVRDAAGNALTPTSWSFTTKVRSWQGAVQMPTSADLSFARAFHDLTDTLWVLWTEAGTPDSTSYITRYTTEFGFETPMPLVRRGPAGHVFAFWRESESGNNVLTAATRGPRDTNFSTPVALQACNAFGCPISNTGVNTAGQLGMAFLGNDFTPDFVYYNGSSWQPILNLDAFLINRVSLVHVVPNGDAIIAFERQGGTGIFSRKYISNTNFLQNNRTIGGSEFLSVVAVTNGDCIAITQSTTTLSANFYTFETDVWSGASPILTGDFDQAFIRGDDDGNAIVAYRFFDGTAYSAVALEYDATNGFSPMPFPALEASDTEVISVVPSMSRVGDAVVSWRENTLTRTGWLNVFE